MTEHAAAQPAVQAPSAMVQVALALAIATSAALVALEALRWQLVQVLSPLSFYPLQEAVGCTFLAASALAALALPFGLRAGRWRALRPLAVQGATVLLVAVEPFPAVQLRLDHWLHRADRQRVVEQVRAGQLGPPGFAQDPRDPGLAAVALPPGLGHLASGGKLLLARGGDRPVMMFLTHRGLLDHVAGFVYAEEGVPHVDERFDARWREIVRLGGPWYWVAR